MNNSRRKCPQCGGRWWRPLAVCDGVPDGYLLVGSIAAATKCVIDWPSHVVYAQRHGAAYLWRVDECMDCGATVTP